MDIRAVTVADAPALLAIYAPYVEDTAITFEYVVPTLEEFSGRIAAISAKYPYLVAEENGAILGYAYASTFKGRAAYDWAVETTVYVAQDARRAGVGRALYAALEEALGRMGILNLNACIAVPAQGAADAHLTADSQRFHEALGYGLVGTFHQCGYKFNTWYDMNWMEKMIGEHLPDQPPVRFGAWQA